MNTNNSLNKSSKISISCSPKNVKTTSNHNDSGIKQKSRNVINDENNLKKSHIKAIPKSVNNVTLSDLNSNIFKSKRDDNFIGKSFSNVSIMSPSIRREDEIFNKIYNVFLGKFIEYKEKIKMYESNSIVECLIKSFDSLSVNFSKFKRISEMLNIFCDPSKTMNIIDNYKN